jgi:hypothetical protein
MKRFTPRLTYANVIATVALFVALGGGAYAATQLPKNSVGPGQLKKEAVTGAKVKKGSLMAGDFAPGQLPAGTSGAAGAKGDAGAQGPPGPEGKEGPQGKEGAPGVAGLEGKAGKEGKQGNEGKQGKKGDPGTANVIYSPWTFGSPATAEEFDNTWDNSTTISAPDLTETMLDQASIEVYVKYPGGMFELPYRSNAGGKFNTMIYTLAPGTITVRRNTDDCNEASCLIGLSPVLEYRYVITPGGTPAS